MRSESKDKRRIAKRYKEQDRKEIDDKGSGSKNERRNAESYSKKKTKEGPKENSEQR